MRKCPYCAEGVSGETLQCEHCGRSLPQPIYAIRLTKLGWAFLATGTFTILGSLGLLNVPTRDTAGWWFLAWGAATLVLGLYLTMTSGSKVAKTPLLTILLVTTFFYLVTLAIILELRRPPSGSIAVQTEQQTKSQTENQQAQKQSTHLPPHRVGDAWKTGNGVSLSLVVHRNFSEDEARQLIKFYREQYSYAQGLSIDMFCDDKYATRSAVHNPSVSDGEYYAHVLFSFTTGTFGTTFNTPTNPAHRGQGSACRKSRAVKSRKG